MEHEFVPNFDGRCNACTQNLLDFVFHFSIFQALMHCCNEPASLFYLQAAFKVDINYYFCHKDFSKVQI